MYRVYKGKPILQRNILAPRFFETWCSGRSDRNLLARFVPAHGVLWVAVTADTLHVSPHIPFNLMFLAEGFGWDHRVPGKTILDIHETHWSNHRRAVAIRYRHATGDEELLELGVSDVPGLIKVLTGIREEQMSGNASARKE